MKKYTFLFTVTALLLSNHLSFAQLVADKGLKLGLSLSTFETDARDFQDNSLKRGVVLGGYVTVDIFGPFYLQPEALFSMKGTKQNDPESGGAGRLEERWTLTYLEVPVVAGLRFRGVHLIAGPSFGFYMDGKYVSEFKGGPNDGQKYESNFSDGHIEGTDIGLVLGAGYSLGKFGFQGRYVLGLGNVLAESEDNIELKNRVLQFIFGLSL